MADFPTGTNPCSVAIGDVSGDAKPDLAVANQGSSTVSVLLGNGAGGLGAKTDFADRTGAGSGASGDLGGRRKPELEVGEPISNTGSGLPRQGAGSLRGTDGVAPRGA